MTTNESFIRDVGSLLGCAGPIRELGISRELTADVAGRPVEVGTNGSMVWLKAVLRWSELPLDGSSIVWAPEGSYVRAQFELDGEKAQSGNEAFDRTFLILGPSAPQIAGLLDTGVDVFLRFEGLRPSVETHEVLIDEARVRSRCHLRCQPDLFEGAPRPGFVEMGTERFLPTFAAEWARGVAELANSLEAASDRERARRRPTKA